MSAGLIAEPSPDLDAWERQPGEIDTAWRLFQVYRDMNGATGRSYARVVRETGKSASYVRQVEKYARRYRWQERIEAWDRDQDRRDREAREQARREMERGHIELAQRAREILVQRLGVEGGTITVTTPSGDEIELPVLPINPNDLNWRDLPRLLEAIVKTERLALGQPVDLAKGAFMLTSADVAAILSGVLELTEEFWGDDPRWALYLQRFQTLPLS